MAQKNKSKDFIYIAADGKGDLIRLRWAPSSPLLWQLGNRYGYTITKYQVSNNGQLTAGVPKQEPISSVPVKPATPSLMKAFGERDSMMAVMSALIYDSSELTATAGGAAGVLGRSSLIRQRFGYAILIADLDYSAAQAAALGFTDKHVKKGERYIYKITINIPEALQKEVPYKEGAVFCVAGEQWKTPGIGRPELEINDNYVTLHWNIEHLNAFYTAYEIERSGDGIHYVPATELPFVQMAKSKTPTLATFTDSLYEPDTDSIYYRVRGVSPFGERSAFSPPVAERNFVTPTYRPHIDSIKYMPGSPLLRICWNLPDSVQQKAESLQVLVSNKASGPYFPVTNKPLSPLSRDYIDSTHFISSYYKLSVVYKEKHKTFTSLPYLHQGEDSIAPEKPVLVKAVIDSLGKVTLHWKPNKEADLLGYRVFRANSLHEEFTEITQHPYTNTVWHDSITLNTLTANVYYTLLAVDNYYNASHYSDTILLKRPDTIAPAPAVIIGSLLKGDSLQLRILASHSEDVLQYELRRIDIAQPNDTLLLATLPQAKTDSLFYADTTAMVGNTYQYILATIDSSHNRSTNRSGLVVYEPGFRKAVELKSATADKDKRHIQLQWQYAATGVQKFIIYRSKAGSAFTTLCTLPAGTLAYTDTDININNTYGYKIKAVFTNGKHSLISTVKEVVY